MENLTYRNFFDPREHWAGDKWLPGNIRGQIEEYQRQWQVANRNNDAGWMYNAHYYAQKLRDQNVSAALADYKGQYLDAAKSGNTTWMNNAAQAVIDLGGTLPAIPSSGKSNSGGAVTPSWAQTGVVIPGFTPGTLNQSGSSSGQNKTSSTFSAINVATEVAINAPDAITGAASDKLLKGGTKSTVSKALGGVKTAGYVSTITTGIDVYNDYNNYSGKQCRNALIIDGLAFAAGVGVGVVAGVVSALAVVVVGGTILVGAGIGIGAQYLKEKYVDN